ncbi:MAG: sigma-70 family RNA polymerase sigma factor [Ruminococcaceae bacterium]|nr:sigma-70 family RNA polymerase sigma factor [Oscillospiraceae bacterium]
MEMTKAELYCRDFAGAVYYYCLRKTGSEQNAEELAARIGLEVIAALHRGTKPQNFAAWVWQIARNQFARFAKAAWYAPDSDRADIDEYAEMLSDADDMEKELILREDLALLRRELAFIRTDYRQILVAHYFEDKSVSVIARELNLPLGTVKTRLQSSRKVLKEGMDMAREFGKRSYNPEQITFVNSCSNFGSFGQPWTILNHLMYKNIFLEAYGNPSTAEQLSMELGIALPYMEAELEYLTRETFLIRRDNRYETAFPIISREAQRRIHDRQCADVGRLTDLLTKLIDTLNDACQAANVPYYGDYIPYETAKWTLLIRAFDRLSAEAGKDILPPRKPYTRRPDQGEWDIVGYQDTDWRRPSFVGQHGSGCGGSAQHFSQYKFNYKNIMKRTPEYLPEEEGTALAALARGEVEKCSASSVESLIRYGYARRAGDSVVPAVAVFADKHPETKLSADVRGELAAIAGEIRGIFREEYTLALDVIRADFPPRICELLHSDFVDITERGYVFEDALTKGWITYTDDLPLGTGAYLVM